MDQEEQGANRDRERNDRVIVAPLWHDRLGEFERASDLPERLRQEIEQFFERDVFYGKEPENFGLERTKKASAIIKESNKAYLHESRQLAGA